MTRPLLGFDTETTGTDPHTARIVSASLVWRDRGTRERTWMIDPGVPIPEAAASIHGIHDTTGGRQPHEALAEITHGLTRGWTIVVFNAPYDLTVLDAELRRHGMPRLTDQWPKPWSVLDPLMLDWAMQPNRQGPRTLAALCDLYGCADRLRHDATQDAWAAIELVDLIFSTYPEELKDTARMADLQTTSHRRWVEHVNARRAKHGQIPDAVHGWPLGDHE